MKAAQHATVHSIFSLNHITKSATYPTNRLSADESNAYKWASVVDPSAQPNDE